MGGKMDFDSLMNSLAAAESTAAPRVNVDIERVLQEADARRPQLWRDCAVFSLLAAAAVVVVAFTLGFNAPADASSDSLYEMYEDCENTFALYSYSDFTGK